MSIFAIADATWGAVGVGKDSKEKSPFNNTYDSVVGNGTVFTIGAGTTVNTYSSSLTAVTDLQEMLRIFANFSPENKYGNFFLNHLVYNSGGGQTLFLFGPNKSLGYRLSRNFTSDRYCQTKGVVREGRNITSLKDHVDDVTWQPKDKAAEKRHMILAILFSLSLLIWDLCIVYKMKTASSVGGVDTSIGGDSSPNSKASNANIMALLIYEHTCTQLLEIVERYLCAFYTADNAANDADNTVKDLETQVKILEFLTLHKDTVNGSVPELIKQLTKSDATADEVQDAYKKVKIALPKGLANIEAVLPKLREES